MKVLTAQETDQVAGGLSVFGITGIETGLALIGQATAVGKAAVTMYAVGYGLGTAFNYGFEYFTGDTVGGWLYDFINC